MKTLLKTVRDTLVADATLIALVGAATDIASSYAPKTADYPTVNISIGAGGSMGEVSGVSRATLQIDVRADVNKLAAHNIYARIKVLLHNQEQSVTDSACLVHLILESDFDDSRRDQTNDVWLISAEYTVIFSTTSVVAFSAVDGKIYADPNNVTVDSSKEIASFRGLISLRVAFEGASRSEQERFVKSTYYRKGEAMLTMEEVTFKPASFDLLWSVTVNESDTLVDGSTASTSYKVTQATVPSYLQFLFRCTQTNNSKALEILAAKAVCESLIIPFSKKDLTIYDCTFTCLGDASDGVVKVSLES